MVNAVAYGKTHCGAAHQMQTDDPCAGHGFHAPTHGVEVHVPEHLGLLGGHDQLALVQLRQVAVKRHALETIGMAAVDDTIELLAANTVLRLAQRCELVHRPAGVVFLAVLQQLGYFRVGVELA